MSMFDQKMSILHILTTAVLASGPVFVFVGVLVKQSTENVTQTKSKTAPSVNVFSRGFLLIFAFANEWSLFLQNFTHFCGGNRIVKIV